MPTFKHLSYLIVGAAALAILPAAAAGQTADYTMHEWGLVSFMTPEVEYLTSGFGGRTGSDFDYDEYVDFETVERTQGKPVIYLTPGPTFNRIVEVSVQISIPDGALHEIYPLAPHATQPALAASTTYLWDNIRFEDHSCGAEHAPDLEDLECTTLGQDTICEAAELPIYLRPVENCLSVDGVNAPILLWNSRVRNWPTPVEVETSTVSTITNVSPRPLVGVFVSDPAGVRYIGDLAPGGTGLAYDTAPVLADQGQLISAVRGLLVHQGLTLNEADDFIDAWRRDQLAFPPPWTAFGFFDRTTIDERAVLTLSPEPAESVRVLAFVAD